MKVNYGDRVTTKADPNLVGTVTSRKGRGPSKDEYFVRFDNGLERLVRSCNLAEVSNA